MSCSSSRGVYSSRLCLWSEPLSPARSISLRRLANPRNNAPSDVHTYNHGEISTSSTTAPATARSTKPELMAMMSRITIRFRNSEYAPLMARYTAATSAKSGSSTQASADPATASVTATATAATGETTPAAMGRWRFLGW